MNLGKISKLVTALVVTISIEVFSINKLAANTFFTIIGLTPNNTLVSFGSKNNPIRVTGIDGNLQGIDFRPANGLLYGVTDTNKIYTINPETGVATFVSNLSTSFNGGFQSGVDFNPVADRLRIVGSNNQNFRVNVDTGEVTVDGTLAYDDEDPNDGFDPNITAAAYTNSRAGATNTQLYNIDYVLDALVLQDPPNDGTLTTIGSLSINFAPIGGFDIFTSDNSVNSAFVLSGSTVYVINLSTGAAAKLGNMPRSGFIGLAVTSHK